MKVPKQTQPCVNYSLQILLGEEFQRICQEGSIAYENEKPGSAGDNVRLRIIPSGFFCEHYGKAESLPSLPLKDVEGTPLLYGLPEVRRNGSQLTVHADIIASTYFLVTRYEEVVRRNVRDHYGRFPGKESLPYRAGFLDRPIVEEYAALLRKWLRKVGINVPESRRKFSVLLTHDVDRIRKYPRWFDPIWVPVSSLLGRQPLRNAGEVISVGLGLSRDPLDNFEEIINLDGRIDDGTGNLSSEVMYFFMAGGRSHVDGFYDIRSKVARYTIKQVLESGAKVGLHTSYEAGQRPELIVEEKAKLEEVCGFTVCHNRHHMLTWREGEDCCYLARAGITDDYTLGYPDVAGFRLGVCRPIPLFDPLRFEPFGIEEHPLLLMDCTLENPDYMNLEEDEAFDYCKRLMDETCKHQGQFVMLWHNDAFVVASNNYSSRLYRRLLDYCKQLMYSEKR